MKQIKNLENESLPEKVCVQLASEIEHQLLANIWYQNMVKCQVLTGIYVV
jgi:hypothetical protein